MFNLPHVASLVFAPREHRTDSLSAAFCNLERNAKDDLTRRYEELCAHYGLTPTRSNRGIAHENGAFEGPHGHLKRSIGDALLLRGTANFDDLVAYRGFIDEIVSRPNARNTKRIDGERVALQALPDRRTSDYEEVIVRVTSSGDFTLRKVFNTVPSRLIGCGCASVLILTLPRGWPYPNGKHDQVVDYRHVIHSLRRKPMALLNLVYRDWLLTSCIWNFPSPARGCYEVCWPPKGADDHA